MSGELEFIDTNVLVYLFDNDSPIKQARSRELIGSEFGNFVISPQVIGEFYVTVTRKLARPLSLGQALDAVSAFTSFRVREIHIGLVRAAIHRNISSQISYWDSLIIETAIEAGAARLITEDLQHGQDFDGLLVVNPYVKSSQVV